MSVALPELALALGAGGLTTLSPCVFPILPLVVGGAVQGHRAAPVAMGAGLVASFALLGLAVGALGGLIGLDADLVRQAGAAMLIAFGLVMLVPALSARFAALTSPLASSAERAGRGLNDRSLLGAFALGGLLGMVWSPCSGPLLASALALVASEGGAARGGVILGGFGLGAALPLVAIAYASRAGFARWRDRVLAHADGLKRGFGVLILLIGVAVLLGWDKQLEAWVLDRLPEGWVDLTVRL